MVTALSDAADRLTGLEAGADDFLTKPVNDIALFARVRSLVRLKRMMEELQLREEVCGRFAHLPGSEPAEDLGGARILVLEDNKPAPAPGALTLTPIASELIQGTTRAAAAGRAAAPIEPSILAPALFDLDRFKLINDSWGHLAGDEVLCEVAKRALHVVRSFDLVGRYGGEEFVVLMPETNLQIALFVAERLRIAIADAPFVIAGVATPLRVTVSIGVATTLEDEDSPTELLRRADIALYAAKDGGRNCLMSWPVGAAAPQPIRELSDALP